MSIQSEINRLTQNISAAFTAVGNKGGTVPTSKTSGNLATAINSIPEATDPILQSKTVSPSTSKQTVTPDSGYDGLSSVTVNAMTTATQATPSISVSTSGLITASATQTAGYVTSGTKSTMKQLTTQAAQTITPGTSDKTIASGRYLTGTQTIKGDANLVSGNIKRGVSIFGVDGSHEGVELNFEVVGGTSAPSNPKENTIWVNTSTTITSWIFSAEEPSPAEAGMVWISVGASSTAAFNALKKNGIQVYPVSAKQYIGGAWVAKTAKSYQGGAWIGWFYVVLQNGEFGNTSLVDELGANADQGILADGSGRLYHRTFTATSALVLKTPDKIPKTVNKLSITARMENIGNSGGYNMFFLSTYDKWSDCYNNRLATISPFTAESTSNKTYTFDLSNVTVDAYLWGAFQMGSASGTGNPRLVVKDIVEVV